MPVSFFVWYVDRTVRLLGVRGRSSEIPCLLRGAAGRGVARLDCEHWPPVPAGTLEGPVSWFAEDPPGVRPERVLVPRQSPEPKRAVSVPRTLRSENFI